MRSHTKSCLHFFYHFSRRLFWYFNSFLKADENHFMATDDLAMQGARSSAEKGVIDLVWQEVSCLRTRRIKFHEQFSIVTHIWRKFHSAVIHVTMKWLPWNLAHDMIAVLSWYVQNFVWYNTLLQSYTKTNFSSNLNHDGKIIHKMDPGLLGHQYSQYCNSLNNEMLGHCHYIVMLTKT